MTRLRGEWPLPIGIASTAAFLVFGKAWLDGPRAARMVRIRPDVAVHRDHGLRVRGRPPRGSAGRAARRAVRHARADAVDERHGDDDDRRRDADRARQRVARARHDARDRHDRAERARRRSLLVGGLRYHEQTYNLYSANSFLAVILPLVRAGARAARHHARRRRDPTLSTLQSVFLIFMSLALYGVFLGIQTLRHRDYFVAPERAARRARRCRRRARATVGGFHLGMLVAYAIPIVLLAKQIARPIDYGISVLRAPAAFGGLLVAVLILAPESMTARPRRARQSAPAVDQRRARHGAVEHQPDDSRRARDRLSSRISRSCSASTRSIRCCCC